MGGHELSKEKKKHVDHPHDHKYPHHQPKAMPDGTGNFFWVCGTEGCGKMLYKVTGVRN
ncbi:MAG TPA: hypothetical protein VI953_00785 [Candidatus Paceibacterota bacterium]